MSRYSASTDAAWNVDSLTSSAVTSSTTSTSSSSSSSIFPYSRPPPTWSNYLHRYRSTLIGLTGCALVIGLIGLALSTGQANGRRNRRKKKDKIQRGVSPRSPRTHGLLLDPSQQRISPVGLRNVGNSCFMNALLQGLQSNTPFLEYVIRLQAIATQLTSYTQQELHEAYAASDLPASSQQSPSVTLYQSLRFINLLLHLIVPQSSNQPLNPIEFYDLVVQQGRLSRFAQQDAHELFIKLLDLLEQKGRYLAQLKDAVVEYTTKRQGLESLLPEEKKEIIPEMGASSMELPSASTVFVNKPINPDGEDETKEDEEAADSNGTISLSHIPSSASIAETVLPTSSAASSPISSSSSPLSPPASDRNSPPDADGSSNTAASSTSSAAISALVAPAFQFPVDPFQGLTSHFLVCTTCWTQSAATRTEVFNSIGLPFKDAMNGDLHSLEDMLRAYVKLEQVTDVRCEQCKWNERRVLLGQLLNETRIKPTKGIKKRDALLALLRKTDEVIQAHLIRLQPLSSAFLKKQQDQDFHAGLKSLLNGNDSAAASPTSTSSSSSSPKDEFLNGTSNGHDPFLSPRRSAASSPAPPSQQELAIGGEYFSQLSLKLSSPDFLSTLPDSCVDQLQQLCHLDPRRHFSKGVALARLPPSICFHLNRLQGGSKITTLIPFPLGISLYRYTQEYVQSEHQTNITLSAVGSNASKWSAHKLAKGIDPEKEQQAWYELDAVIVHQGGGSGGHYIAYIRLQTEAEQEEEEDEEEEEVESKLDSNGAESTTPPTNGLQFIPTTSDDSTPSIDGLSPPSSSSAFSLTPNNTSRRRSPQPPTLVTRWWYTSDAQCYEVDVSEVMRAEAYMLIYTRTNKSSNHL